MMINMVESDCLDENLMNEDFDGILDFPLESLDEDGLDADFDASVYQRLGPIPSDAFMSGCLNAVPNSLVPSPVSVLEQSSSRSGGKTTSLKFSTKCRRSKRARLPTSNSWLLMPPVSSTAFASKKKNSDVKKGKDKKKRKLSPLSGAMESGLVQKCTHCEVTESPLWRWGPLGPKTLCNACGVRYRSGRLFPEYRPAASPTFVPCLHSNSHRTVVKMRREAVKDSQGDLREVFPECQPRRTKLSPLSGAMESSLVRKCTHCEVTKTPEWREGPLGPKTLCDACGVRYLSGRLFSEYQAAASPTFSSSLNPCLFSDATSASKKNNSDAKKGKEKKSKLSPLSGVMDSSLVQKCTHCEVTKTPEWREGPLGPKTLCDACGVRYLSGRLFSEYQAAASPTFSSSLNPCLFSDATSASKKKNSDAKKGKEKKSKLSPLSGVMDSSLVQKCTYCEVTKTPKWREGPLGPKTLCDACGVRYLSGRLFSECQPAASPTFSPSLNPCLSMATAFASKKKNFDAKKGKEKKRLSPLAGTMESSLVQKCTHCEVTETPKWCEGPLGPKTLCNACGPRYHSGQLFPEDQPAASHTVVPSLNSSILTAPVSSTAKKGKEKEKKSEKLPGAMKSGLVRKCAHCEATKTANWREGPLGPKTLCNACGLRYCSGRLFPEDQPAASPTFVPSLNSSMLTAPVSKKGKEKEQKSKELPGATKSGLVQKCAHCEATKTAYWREGPLGPKTLCNACGLRYRSGRLFPEYRPVASPTFVPSLHSNSHRRVIEMIRKAVEESTWNEETRNLIL